MTRSILALAFVLSAASLAAQGPPPGQRGNGPGPDDWARNFFPPELVMQHQAEIGLQDTQRTVITSALQQTQGKFMDMQWKLSAEGEKMGRLLQSSPVNETQVLEEVDRILGMEREIKRAQISLMVRIKNTLTAAQQAKLTEIRRRSAHLPPDERDGSASAPRQDKGGSLSRQVRAVQDELDI